MAYRHLLAPLRVGNVTLRNRSIMGSMHTGMEDKASDFVEMSAYFAERARGQVGLIVTGGIAPNIEGSVLPFAGRLSMRHHVARHRLVTQAVHKEGGLIAMQILHAGRYGYHPLCVAPSRSCVARASRVRCSCAELLTRVGAQSKAPSLLFRPGRCRAGAWRNRSATTCRVPSWPRTRVSRANPDFKWVALIP